MASENNEIKVEFSVETSCESCRQKIENVLSKEEGVQMKELDIQRQKLVVTVDSKYSNSIQEIGSKIEKEAGIRTVFKGLGDTMAAVSEIDGQNASILGVIRLSQLFNRKCLVDGVIDGLCPSQVPSPSLNIHEYGDLSGNNLENVGQVYIPLANQLKPSSSGRASFKFSVDNCDLATCIGRSMIVSDTQKGKPVAGGIVARASPVEGNVKKICVCSGKTLWEEREDQLRKTKPIV